MCCSPTVTTDIKHSFVFKSRQWDHPSFSWFSRTACRKTLVQNACGRGSPAAAHPVVFLGRTADVLRRLVGSLWFLLQSWQEQREHQGICSNCHSRQLSALFVEKRVMVSIQSTAPLLHICWHGSLLRGQASGTQMHDLSQVHRGEKCSWFRIWYIQCPA